jgi:hypothetical protein
VSSTRVSIRPRTVALALKLRHRRTFDLTELEAERPLFRTVFGRSLEVEVQ